MDGMTPAAGHNRPPFDLSLALDPVLIREQLEAEFGHKIMRRDELLAGVSRFHDLTKDGIADDETQAKATDFVKQLKSEAKQVDGLREVAKAPVLATQRLIDGFFKAGIADPLANAARAIEAKMTAYARKLADERRRAAEAAAKAAAEEAARKAEAAAEARDTEALDKAIEAEQAAQDQAAAATNMKAADASRTYGDFGGVSSLTGRWTYRVVDEAAIPRRLLMLNDAAVKAEMKAHTRGGECHAKAPGIEFYRDERVVVR